MSKFFLGYRKTALKPDEIVVCIHVPGTKQHEFVRAYKQAKRRDDDISIVNGCLRCEVDPTTTQIRTFSTGFGLFKPKAFLFAARVFAPALNFICMLTTIRKM